jgi:hypothetical protein
VVLMPIKPAVPVRALPTTRRKRRSGLGPYAAQRAAVLAGRREYLKELGGPIRTSIRMLVKCMNPKMTTIRPTFVLSRRSLNSQQQTSRMAD